MLLRSSVEAEKSLLPHKFLRFGISSSMVEKSIPEKRTDANSPSFLPRLLREVRKTDHGYASKGFSMGFPRGVMPPRERPAPASSQAFSPLRHGRSLSGGFQSLQARRHGRVVLSLFRPALSEGGL